MDDNNFQLFPPLTLRCITITVESHHSGHTGDEESGRYGKKIIMLFPQKWVSANCWGRLEKYNSQSQRGSASNTSRVNGNTL